MACFANSWPSSIQGSIRQLTSVFWASCFNDIWRLTAPCGKPVHTGTIRNLDTIHQRPKTCTGRPINLFYMSVHPTPQHPAALYTFLSSSKCLRSFLAEKLKTACKRPSTPANLFFVQLSQFKNPHSVPRGQIPLRLRAMLLCWRVESSPILRYRWTKIQVFPMTASFNIKSDSQHISNNSQDQISYIHHSLDENNNAMSFCCHECGQTNKNNQNTLPNASKKAPSVTGWGVDVPLK